MPHTYIPASLGIGGDAEQSHSRTCSWHRETAGCVAFCVTSSKLALTHRCTPFVSRVRVLWFFSVQGVDTCLNSGAEVRVCVCNVRTSGLSNVVLLRMPRFSNPSLPDTEHFVSVFSSTSTTRPPTKSLSLWGEIARVCCSQVAQFPPLNNIVGSIVCWIGAVWFPFLISC